MVAPDSAASVATPTFRADVGLALRTWRQSPALPLLALLLAACSAAPVLVGKQHLALQGLLFLLGFPVALFQLGFRATERIWYARRWNGQRITGTEVWTLSWRFLGRLLILGLQVFFPYAGLIGVLYAVLIPTSLSRLTRFGIATGVASLLLDVVLTFVVPALVFTTSDPELAFPIGWRMMLQHRRRAFAYLLTPPLALGLVSQLLARAFSNHWYFLADQLLVAMLDLVFKGAITAYYLRNAPPPPVPVTPTSPADAGTVESVSYRGRHR